MQVTELQVPTKSLELSQRYGVCLMRQFRRWWVKINPTRMNFKWFNSCVVQVIFVVLTVERDFVRE